MNHFIERKIFPPGRCDMAIDPQGNFYVVSEAQNLLYHNNLISKKKTYIPFDINTYCFAFAKHPIQNKFVIGGKSKQTGHKSKQVLTNKVLSMTQQFPNHLEVILESLEETALLVFSKNGNYLGIGTQKTIYLYLWKNKQSILLPNQHNSKLNQIIFSPDQNFICSISSDKTIKIHKIIVNTIVETKCLLTLQLNPNLQKKLQYPLKATFNLQSNAIAIPGMNRVRQLRIKEKSCNIHTSKKMMHKKIIVNCYWYNSKRMITIGLDQTLKIWNYESQQQLVNVGGIYLNKIIKFKQSFIGINNGKIFQSLDFTLLNQLPNNNPDTNSNQNNNIIKIQSKNQKNIQQIVQNQLTVVSQPLQKEIINQNKQTILPQQIQENQCVENYKNQNEKAQMKQPNQQMEIQQKNQTEIQQQKNEKIQMKSHTPSVTENQPNQNKMSKSQQMIQKLLLITKKRNSKKSDLRLKVKKNKQIYNQSFIESKKNILQISTKKENRSIEQFQKIKLENFTFVFCNQHGYVIQDLNNVLKIFYMSNPEQTLFIRQVPNNIYQYFDLNTANFAFANKNEVGVIGITNWNQNLEQILGIALGTDYLYVITKQNLNIFNLQTKRRINLDFNKSFVTMRAYQNLLAIVYESCNNYTNSLFMNIFQIDQDCIKIFLDEQIVPISLGSILKIMNFSFQGLLYTIDSQNKLRTFNFENRNWVNIQLSVQQQKQPSNLKLVGIKNYKLCGYQLQNINQLNHNYFNVLNLQEIQLKITNNISPILYYQKNQIITEINQTLWKNFCFEHEKFRYKFWFNLFQKRNQSHPFYILSKTIIKKHKLLEKIQANDSQFAFLIQNILEEDQDIALQIAKRFIKSQNIRQKIIKLFKKKCSLIELINKLENYYTQILRIRNTEYMNMNNDTLELNKEINKQSSSSKNNLLIEQPKNQKKTTLLQKINQQFQAPKVEKSIKQLFIQSINKQQSDHKNKKPTQNQSSFDALFRQYEQEKNQIKNGIRIYLQNPKVFIKRFARHLIIFRQHHKKIKINTRRMIKHCVYKNEQKNRLKEQEEEVRMSSLRLKMLKQHDMDSYLKLIQFNKNKKINELLDQTNKFLRELGIKIIESKGQNSLSLESQPTSLKQSFQNATNLYYEVTKVIKQKINQQPKILVGGILKSYQITALEWLVSLYNNNLNGILADQMGLGKTIQIIALIAYLIQHKHNIGPYLIIAPLSTVSNWMKQFSLWAPSIRAITMKGQKNERIKSYQQMMNTNWNVCITTYQYISIQRDRLGSFEWNYIIIDQGQKIKSKSTKFKSHLIQDYQSKNKLVLTGTPLQNNLEQLWNLLNFLLPKVFNSSYQFNKWFKIPLQNQNQNIELTEQQKLLIINRLHQVLGLFLLRRMKKQVQSELPEKKQHIIKVELSGLQKILYNQLVKKKENSNLQTSMKIFVQMRKVCNHPFLILSNYSDLIKNDLIYSSSGKFQLLDRILPKLLKFKHRILIFSQMTTTLDILGNYMNFRGVKFLRLDGNLKSDKRNQIIQQFNKENSLFDIMLISTRSGGLGLNLQSADTVIIFDSDWNPQIDIQAQARVHRIGQTKQVLVLRFVTNTYIQSDILQKASQKRKLDSIFIESGSYNPHSNQTDKLNRIQKILNEKKLPLYQLSEQIPSYELVNKFIARNSSQFDVFNEIDQIEYENYRNQISSQRSFQNFNQIQDNNYRLKQQNQIPKEILDRFQNLNQLKEIDLSQQEKKLINEINNNSNQNKVGQEGQSIQLKKKTIKVKNKIQKLKMNIKQTKQQNEKNLDRILGRIRKDTDKRQAQRKNAELNKKNQESESNNKKNKSNVVLQIKMNKKKERQIIQQIDKSEDQPYEQSESLIVKQNQQDQLIQQQDYIQNCQESNKKQEKNKITEKQNIINDEESQIQQSQMIKQELDSEIQQENSIIQNTENQFLKNNGQVVQNLQINNIVKDNNQQKMDSRNRITEILNQIHKKKQPTKDKLQNPSKVPTTFNQNVNIPKQVQLNPETIKKKQLLQKINRIENNISDNNNRIIQKKSSVKQVVKQSRNKSRRNLKKRKTNTNTLQMQQQQSSNSDNSTQKKQNEKQRKQILTRRKTRKMKIQSSDSKQFVEKDNKKHQNQKKLRKNLRVNTKSPQNSLNSQSPEQVQQQEQQTEQQQSQNQLSQQSQSSQISEEQQSSELKQPQDDIKKSHKSKILYFKQMQKKKRIKKQKKIKNRHKLKKQKKIEKQKKQLNPIIQQEKQIAINQQIQDKQENKFDKSEIQVQENIEQNINEKEYSMQSKQMKESKQSNNVANDQNCESDKTNQNQAKNQRNQDKSQVYFRLKNLMMKNIVSNSAINSNTEVIQQKSDHQQGQKMKTNFLSRIQSLKDGSKSKNKFIPNKQSKPLKLNQRMQMLIENQIENQFHSSQKQKTDQIEEDQKEILPSFKNYSSSSSIPQKLTKKVTRKNKKKLTVKNQSDQQEQSSSSQVKHRIKKSGKQIKEKVVNQDSSEDQSSEQESNKRILRKRKMKGVIQSSSPNGIDRLTRSKNLKNLKKKS